MEMVHFIPPSQRRLAMLAAQADTAPVLIYGASGTGKGAIARWIHQNGPRAGRPYLNAKQDISLLTQIPQAQGGTITIPEIGSWPLGEQKILLDFLTTKSISHPENPGLRMLLNVRVIGTTSQTLEGRAQGGLFNPTLLEKLNVFRLEMPPLFRRTEEFEDIVMGIVGEIIRELHKEHIRSLDKLAWNSLKSYDWPGNIRELRNVLRVAVISAQGDRIEATDLPQFGHDRIDFHATREHFEKIYITELLKTFNWQIDETCRMSRMDKATLLSKMKQYGISSLDQNR
ncbi:MAG: sigma-54-dependent Fis family transcriptional regulator [Methylotenera sp.]|nr:sigma-54-dependent Fis family transcriptional regulator [Oligoflexia bacterium]